jgi:copper chaperone CopZ
MPDFQAAADIARRESGPEGGIIMGCECGNYSLVEMEWFVPTLDSEGSAEELRMALEEITAVRGVLVKMPGKTVKVSFDSVFVGAHHLRDVLTRAGFPLAIAL